VDSLPASAPEDPEPMEQILADFERLIVPALSLWNHPRFHAYFANSASAPGILAEALAAAVNTNGMLWKSSPGQVELEQVVLAWLRQWLGLGDEFFGQILDTASTSTMHAIAAARAQADPELRHRAARGWAWWFTPPNTAHSSVEKGRAVARHRAGQRAQDRRRRGVPHAARAAADGDHDGSGNGADAVLRPSPPWHHVGQQIDPVVAIQEIAEAEELWHTWMRLYAGPATFLAENRWMLEGAERVRFAGPNPHKWLFTPVDCSGFLLPQTGDFCRRAFSLVPEYLLTATTNARSISMDMAWRLGRRFRALQAVVRLRYFAQKSSRFCARSIALARELAETVRADRRFELVAPAAVVTGLLPLSRSDGRQPASDPIVSTIPAWRFLLGQRP